MDRNGKITSVLSGLSMSLSARRAWIEIEITLQTVLLVSVSLSARRAWIEIVSDSLPALKLIGRSPQGERG